MKAEKEYRRVLLEKHEINLGLMIELGVPQDTIFREMRMVVLCRELSRLCQGNDNAEDDDSLILNS